MELSERKRKILVAIIEKYIAHGEPVGSKTLCQEFSNSVSSATIRNDMAELAALGFLEQPHASAGRIPSQQGYRYYVDSLMNKRELSEGEQKAIKSMLSYRSGDPEQLLEAASSVLAQLTKCATIATTLGDDEATISKVELVTLGQTTAILVVVTSKGIIKNRVCRLDYPLTDKLITAFYEVVRSHFIGTAINEVSTVTLQSIVASLGDRALMLSPLIITLAEIIHEISELDIVFEGQSNLLSIGSTANAQELLEFLSRREILKRIVNEQKHRLNVVIGQENPHKELQNSSVIIARYKIDGHDAGALGIIGSTRIDYAQLIPNIEYLTGLVSSLLSDATGG